MRTLIATSNMKNAGDIVSRIRFLHGSDIAIYTYEQHPSPVFADITLYVGARYIVLLETEDVKDWVRPELEPFDGVYLFDCSNSLAKFAKQLVSPRAKSFLKRIKSTKSIEGNRMVRCTFPGCENWVRNDRATWRCRKHWTEPNELLAKKCTIAHR